jgi:hypothetical protein
MNSIYGKGTCRQEFCYLIHIIKNQLSAHTHTRTHIIYHVYKSIQFSLLRVLAADSHLQGAALRKHLI